MSKSYKRSLCIRFRGYRKINSFSKNAYSRKRLHPAFNSCRRLRYHGMAPLVSHLKELNLIEARAEDQLDCFKAGLLFARNEGIIPAPESNHAIKTVIDEALRCKQEGVSRTIAFNLSGHGLLDVGSYASYF